MLKRPFLCAIVLCALHLSIAGAQEKSGDFGARVGIGTDISGGIAYGAQLDYIHFHGLNGSEVGITMFGGHFEEDTDEDIHSYHEETDVLVVAAFVNYLFRYSMELDGPYIIGGMGAGSFSVDWEESSDTDTSLGPPLPGGGSKQSEDGISGGLILNIGLGYRFNERFDLRVQMPTFFISGGDERGSATVPTFTLTAGMRF